MNIGNLIEPGRVLSNVKARSKKHSLEILAELLAAECPGMAQAEIFELLNSREKLGCTALGQGVAIPHGRMEGLDDNVGAFLRLAEPVDFDAPNGEPVDLIFGLLVPERCGDGHLDALSHIAKMLSEPKFRSVLRAATTSRSLYDLLVNFDLKSQASA